MIRFFETNSTIQTGIYRIMNGNHIDATSRVYQNVTRVGTTCWSSLIKQSCKSQQVSNNNGGKKLSNKPGESKKKELGHSVKELSGFRVTLQTDTGVSMTEISGLIDMLLKRVVVVVVIVMMVMMMAMIVMVTRVMVVMIVMMIREVIVGGWLAIRVPGGR